jgi:hypothetical protein
MAPTPPPPLPAEASEQYVTLRQAAADAAHCCFKRCWCKRWSEALSLAAALLGATGQCVQLQIAVNLCCKLYDRCCKCRCWLRALATLGHPSATAPPLQTAIQRSREDYARQRWCTLEAQVRNRGSHAEDAGISEGRGTRRCLTRGNQLADADVAGSSGYLLAIMTMTPRAASSDASPRATTLVKSARDPRLC